MHATEEDLQAIAQIEESETGGQEDDDDDDLPEPQAPLLPCRPAVVQVIVQRSAGRKRTAHDATTPRLERTRRMPSCQLSFCKHLATALSPFDVSSLKHCVPVSIK